jgi:hypothetical protein
LDCPVGGKVLARLLNEEAHEGPPNQLEGGSRI